MQAAAQAWGVDASALTLEEGVIKGAGQSAPLGDFVAAAAQLTAPEAPRLKDPSEFRLIGNPDVRHLDSAIKGNGEAKFAIDVFLPGQMIAMIARPEQRGALATAFDDAEAKSVKGYIRAAIMPNKAGVVVYAENTWAAMQARDLLDVTWDVSAAETRSSDQIEAEIRAALDAEPVYNVNKTDIAATTGAIEAAAQVVEETFYFPLLAHAPMEPLNCTIEQTAEGKIILHDGAQMPTGPHMAFAQIFQLPMEMIEIRTMLAKGIKATINSDDPAYFRAYMNDNFIALAEEGNFSKAEIIQLSQNAFDIAWLSEDRRQHYLEQLHRFAGN